MCKIYTMEAVIISIGDEILNGTTINTNASWIATQIQPLGLNIAEVLAISDKRQHILDTLHRYGNSGNIIFITGGLGPTKDDITKKTLAEFFSSELIFHEEIYEKLKAAFAKRNIPFTENNRDQAIYPHNCTILPNSLGTAQGMWFRSHETVFISMPGVPFEMKGLMIDVILPKIKSEFKLPVIYNLHLMTSGISESLLAKKIEPVEAQLPENISLAYLPSPGVVKLRLTARGNDENDLKYLTQKYADEIKNILGDGVYADSAIALEAHIGLLLKNAGATLCTAESCTGGKIAHKITSVAGSSQYFKGGAVVYSNELKMSLLGVSSSTLEAHGAVSEATVSEMLDGALKNLGADFAIAVSGIAGPDGGSDEKPVGTIWIGVAGAGGKNVQKYFFNKNRDINIEYACMFALHELRMLLTKYLVKA